MAVMEPLILILVSREPVVGVNRQPWQVKALRSLLLLSGPYFYWSIRVEPREITSRPWRNALGREDFCFSDQRLVIPHSAPEGGLGGLIDGLFA
jgi:hypothetical protein